MSKFLSMVLRHRPDVVGIALDAAGWVPVDELLDALARHGRPLARAALEELVCASDKQRFARDLVEALALQPSQGALLDPRTTLRDQPHSAVEGFHQIGDGLQRAFACRCLERDVVGTAQERGVCFPRRVRGANDHSADINAKHG